MKRYIKSANTNLCKNALNARLGDTVYDRLKERYGEVVRESQSGNYDIIYVDFNDGSRPLKINVMDDAQRVGRFCLVEASTNVTAKTGLHNFYEWYDKLPYTIQMKVDDLADDMRLPEYDECSTEDLDELRERYLASKKKKVNSKSVKANTQSRGKEAAESIQKFINGYGFDKFDVYNRDDNNIAIDIEEEDENEVESLLNRLHAWNLDADIWEHYIEINIEDDDRW